MLTALIVLVGERVTVQRVRGGAVGDWIVIVLLAFGASNAKVTILPLLLAALVPYTAYRWGTTRRVPTGVWVAGGIMLVMALGVYVALYRGHSSGLVFDPAHAVRFFTEDMLAVSAMRLRLEAVFDGVPLSSVAVGAAGIVVGALGLLGAQLIGLVWLFRRPRPPLTAAQAWLLSIFALGLLVTLTFRSEWTGNQYYFLFDGMVAGCLLSAQGLSVAWSSRPSSGLPAARIATLGLAWLVLLGALIAVPTTLDLFTGTNGTADTYLFLYGGLIVSLVLLYAAARRWVGNTLWVPVALVTTAVLLVGAMDTPGNRVEPALSEAQPAAGARMTPYLYRALAWIRDRTPAASVIAVNNREALDFDHAAFSERRVFFGGWGYALRIRESGYQRVSGGFLIGTAGVAGAQTFPDRLLLNNAVFQRADPRALKAMIDRYGVRYLVIDRTNGFQTAPTLSRLGRVVYDAPGVTVLAVS
jgi:hypothetical protein